MVYCSWENQIRGWLDPEVLENVLIFQTFDPKWPISAKVLFHDVFSVVIEGIVWY